MSMPKEIIEESKGVALALYQDLLQPSMKVVGKALETTLQFLLTPFVGVQFLNEVVKKNMQYRLQQYDKQLQQIPKENICDVHPELGVPILQRLSYTTNDDIADMFISLLTTASNIETLAFAHPTFISIIDRLSPDEARMLLYIHQTYIKNNKTQIPYITIRARMKEVKPVIKDINNPFEFDGLDDLLTYDEIKKWQTTIQCNVSLNFPDKIHIYWNNLISCGIIIDEPMKSLPEEIEEYNKIEALCDIQAIQKQRETSKYNEVFTEKWLFSITELGQDFINACLQCK